jgi:glycine cleavage system H protein
MDMAFLDWNGVQLWVSRSGYTREDGYEISVPNAQARAFAEALLQEPEVQPIGLGARDSLRLEAGLCLYGHDIDRSTTPIAANLAWAIPKVRRTGGERAGGFPGAARILHELATSPDRRRVGLRPDGRAPMREGTELYLGSRHLGRLRAIRRSPHRHGLCHCPTCENRSPTGGGTARQAPARHYLLPALSPHLLQTLRTAMKYTKDHEWLRVEGDLVVVGITEHAATQLGDVVFVELPEIETMVAEGDEVVVIESVKAASDILAPVDGEIVAVNEALVDNPALVNEDATGAAWFFKMRLDDLSVLDAFMDEDEYNELIG